MKNFIKTTMIMLVTLLSTVTFSVENTEENIGEELQYNSNNHQSTVVKSTDPEDLWNDYLASHKIKLGENKKNGHTFFIAFAAQEVGKLPSERGFIDSKDTAYRKALINAKSDLSNFLGTQMKSNSTFTEKEINEDIPQSYIKAVIGPVSTADRAHLLTDLTLDDQIKKFDPTWDGTNKAKTEKIIDKMVEQNQKYVEYMSSHAREYIQGASPIFSAEGVSDGVYTVTVGIVWSYKSSKVAEAIYLPNKTMPKGKKHLLTVADRLKNMSNTELAASMGVRMWRDEKGMPIVLSFSQADGKGFKSIAKKKTTLKAKTEIAKFVAEIIESDTEVNTDEVMQSYNDDSKKAFNNSDLKAKITARQTGLNLSGISTIHYRKFRHPASDQKMVVNVMAWTPNSSALARGLREMTRIQKTKFNATKGGTVFENTSKGLTGTTGNSNLNSNGGYVGATSDPDDF
jgi:hypothetical protein